MDENRTAEILPGPHVRARGEVLPSLLRALRENKKGTRSGSDVARALDVWQSHVVKVETGKAKPTDEYIDKFCDFLGLSSTWNSVMRLLSTKDNSNEAMRKHLPHLLPTRILLGPRSTIPITVLDTYLVSEPMVILTREYLDAQFSFWGDKAMESRFIKKTPNPRCYTVRNAVTTLTFFDSFLATDYQLFEDVLIVSDYYYFLHFDVETIPAFIRRFDDMRMALEPYFPEA